MKNVARWSMVALLVAASSLTAVRAVQADDSAIALEGRGSRRTELNTMQGKPFPSELWSKLEGWTGGDAVTPDTVKNKAVLLVWWASWYRSSYAGMSLAEELKQKYGPMGLLVVGIHHPRGFDRAQKLIDDNKWTFRIAHDTKGEVAGHLKFEGGGPAFYIIDRAGNLRFADVQRKSVADAVEMVVKETPDEAAKAKPAPAKTDATGKGGQNDYAAVKWPAENRGHLNARNFQGKPFPVKLGKSEMYLGVEPLREGKIVILDFWATWCGPCKMSIPKLEDLAKKYPDDVVVIGVSDEKPADVKKFLEKNPPAYPQAIDKSTVLYRSMNIQAIPHVVIMSTDGVVRWQGNPAANFDEIDKVVGELVKIDPGVKARAKKS